jgi:hypothetical protein
MKNNKRKPSRGGEKKETVQKKKGTGLNLK